MTEAFYREQYFTLSRCFSSHRRKCSLHKSWCQKGISCPNHPPLDFTSLFIVFQVGVYVGSPTPKNPESQRPARRSPSTLETSICSPYPVLEACGPNPGLCGRSSNDLDWSLVEDRTASA
ncbi:hypothetical protein GQ53DRAFT_200589 [Thozetella sp. PMI_491]|nr:hypothetical protein GQ53DRAFT_200589 [Thozetella sp. PMI_491]